MIWKMGVTVRTVQNCVCKEISNFISLFILSYNIWFVTYRHESDRIEPKKIQYFTDLKKNIL